MLLFYLYLTNSGIKFPPSSPNYQPFTHFTTSKRSVNAFRLRIKSVNLFMLRPPSIYKDVG
nr:MAG TPA: hypothetical protein [Bacteriophage sp.]